MRRYEDEDALRGELADVRARIQERLDKMDFMEKNKKWNVDNLSHTAHDRTILTGKGSDPADLVGGMVSGKSSTTGPVGPTSERDAVESYSKFVDEHEGTLEDFLATRSIEDCRELGGNQTAWRRQGALCAA